MSGRRAGPEPPRQSRRDQTVPGTGFAKAEAAAPHARHLPRGNDEMVGKFQIEHPRQGPQPLRCPNVLSARARIARRVVVREDEAAGPEPQGGLDDSAVAPRDGIAAPLGKDLATKVAPVRTKIDDHHDLPTQLPEMVHQDHREATAERPYPGEGLDQSCQAASVPLRRTRRMWSTVPAKRTIMTTNVGPSRIKA